MNKIEMINQLLNEIENEELARKDSNVSITWAVNNIKWQIENKIQPIINNR